MTQIAQILELRQKRCSLRFGVGACEATGAPKCLQSYQTCRFKSAFNLDGELRWFFHRAGDPVPFTAGATDADNISAPSIPVLESVQTEESRINIGAVREGESPFGLRGTISVSLTDFEFRNQFGDFYADERAIKGSIGALLLAWMGEAVPQLELYWYQGVKGQTLDQMTQRRFDVIKIDPPSGGKWTIQGYDPLHKALRRKAQFPRATDIRLVGAIDNATTAITVSGREADINDAFGNTPERYARIGSEIISYTGYAADGDNWTLQGVIRGRLETQAANHGIGDGVQRIGHFDRMLYWQIVHYILTNHTTIDAALIPFATQWTSEGNSYLSTLFGTGTFTDPRPVDEVCGIAMRDGQFSLWWDAVAQEIKIKALRQPREAPMLLDEARHLVNVQIVRDPESRITRFITYYDRQNPIIGLDQATNYRTVRARVDLETEGAEYADGTVRAQVVYSPLMRADANAVLTQAMQLQRYRETPVYISFQVTRKDFTLSIGDVVQIQSSKYIDTLGNPLVTSWEIIQGPKEVQVGLVYEYLAQSFVLFARPSFIMANDAPDFTDATDAQKLNACYISQNDGTMPDGSPAYVIQ